MKPTNHWLFAALMIFLVSPIAMQAQLYDLFQALTHENADGDKLLYRFLEPEVTPKKGETFPIIVFLHGAGERGDDNRAQLMHVMARFVSYKMRAKYPCYIVAPQCPEEEQWISADRTGRREFDWKDQPSAKQKMIMAIVDDLIEKKKVDAERVYVMGLSMGGGGTWDIITHYPDRFAAAVPVCGWGNAERAEKIKHIPIWAFHGADDPVVLPSGSRDMIKAIREAGGNPIYTEFENVKHDSWVPAFDENPFVYDWLFSQRRR